MKVGAGKQIYDLDDELMILYKKHYGEFENSGTFVDLEFLIDVTKYIEHKKERIKE